ARRTDGPAYARVLALGDVALERRVLQGMILGVHGKVVLLRRLGETLGQRPGGEHTIPFEPEVPVQTPCVVFLDHEALTGRGSRCASAHRLRGPLGVALG